MAASCSSYDYDYFHYTTTTQSDSIEPSKTFLYDPYAPRVELKVVNLLSNQLNLPRPN